MRGRLRRLATVLACSTALLSTSAALAVDGVIEINQARALAGGITASDTSGFPVTIDTSGSYRLTSNLTVDSSTDAIFVTSAATVVAIDLNGYAIVGPVVCATPPTCTGDAGSGNGIEANSAAGNSLRVSNGEIRGTGNDGIITNAVLFAERVHVSNNGQNGLFGLNETSLVDVVAEHNYGHGLIVADRAQIRGCSASRNGQIGIFTGNSSVLVNNSVSDNIQLGIEVGNGSTIIGNTIDGNGGDAVYGEFGVTVINNTARGNTGYGIEIASGGYAGNVLTNNHGGDAQQQVSGGAQMGTNFCGIDTVCP